MRRPIARCGRLMVAAALAGCHGPPESTFTDPQSIIPSPPTASAGQSAADVEATAMFATRCSPCHGANGHGDGVAAAALTPHPRNFSDRAWQASITDANIERVIREGGEAVGKSALMPANPDLVARPEIISALRARVRGTQ